MSDQATTVCTLLRITRTDAVVLGMTDLDADVVYDGVTYVSASGYTPSSYDAGSSLGVANADVSGLFDAAGLDKSEAAAGLFDNAEIRISLYDWQAETLVRHLATGWWGEVKLYRDKYVAEFRSLAQALSNTVVRTIAPQCDATFCDSRCGLDAATYTVTGTITSITSNSVLFDTSRAEAEDFFRFGVITFTSGANDGISMEVKASNGAQITLYQAMPFDVEVGDTYSLLEGCDKTVADCASRSNIDNFRGFPTVPGPDKAFRIHGQRG